MSGTLTEQLRRFSSGDRELAGAVFREVLPKLHQLAVRALRREHYAPLSASDLIHDVWLKNLGKGGWDVKDRQHFYAIAARAMRHELVNVARHRLARGESSAGVPLSLDSVPSRKHPAIPSPEEVVAVAILIDKLDKKDP